jgi:hypothetical protein
MKMANEKRLIDANALKDRFKLRLDWLKLDVHDEYTKGLYHGCDYDMALIEEQPTVDAVEVVHGRWHEVDGETEWECHYRCSKCFTRSYELTNYCPNCGAKMDGDGNAID